MLKRVGPMATKRTDGIETMGSWLRTCDDDPRLQRGCDRRMIIPKEHGIPVSGANGLTQGEHTLSCNMTVPSRKGRYGARLLSHLE